MRRRLQQHVKQRSLTCCRAPVPRVSIASPPGPVSYQADQDLAQELMAYHTAKHGVRRGGSTGLGGLTHINLHFNQSGFASLPV